MGTKTRDDYSNTSPWLRPQIEEPANVLLLGPQTGEATKDVCQRLLTTVSYRQEHILAIGYGQKTDTWLKDLEYIPNNLTIKWCNDDNRPSNNGVTELRNILDDFLHTSTNSHRIVYIDSLTSLVRDNDSVTAYDICQDLTQQLHTANAVGFIRVDPIAHDQQEIESLSKLFDFTAELTDNAKEWDLRRSIYHNRTGKSN